jgi:hypothetical protein
VEERERDADGGVLEESDASRLAVAVQAKLVQCSGDLLIERDLDLHAGVLAISRHARLPEESSSRRHPESEM